MIIERQKREKRAQSWHCLVLSNAYFYTTYRNDTWHTDITYKVQETHKKLPNNIEYFFHKY